MSNEVKRSPGGAIIPEDVKVTVIKKGKHSTTYYIQNAKEYLLKKNRDADITIKLGE